MGQIVIYARNVLRGYFCHRRQESAPKSPMFLSCDTLAANIKRRQQTINLTELKLKEYV